MAITKAELQAKIDAGETISDLHEGIPSENGITTRHTWVITAGTVTWMIEPGFPDVIPDVLEVV